MLRHPVTTGRSLRAAIPLLTLLVMAGCGSRDSTPPTDPAFADRFLMERGNETIAKRRWIDAREYFRQIVENYPQSAYRADAKLAIADSYLGEGSAESLVLAANEYQEFLMFYPTHPRVDYAQFQVGMTYFDQMRAANRDQTPTREALAQFDLFFRRYPNSPLTPQVKEKWRIARDRLSDDTYRVGLFYFRRSWCPGAASRFQEVIKEDPGFSRMDGVYYHLAECHALADNKAEAIPLFARVVGEYETSEYFKDAQKRLEELKAQ